MSLQCWFGYEAPAWRRALPAFAYAAVAAAVVLVAERSAPPAPPPAIAPAPALAGTIPVSVEATAAMSAWQVLADGVAVPARPRSDGAGCAADIPAGARRLLVTAEAADPLAAGAVALRVRIGVGEPRLFWSRGSAVADLALGGGR